MLLQISSSAATTPKKRMERRIRSLRLVRHGVMLFFFLFLLHVAWEHQAKGGGPRGTPSVEAYCPFGGVENLYHFLTTGGFIRRIEPSAMILLAAVLLLTLLFSRGFCGWICPFGSVQEWLGMLGRRIFGRSYNPSGPLERKLLYLKYVLLAIIVGLTWHVGTLIFRDYDPFLAFFHLGTNVREMPYAYAALALVLLGSLRYERFFCKYACPLGAVIGIFSRLGFTRVVRDDDGCKACNVCQKACWAHVDIMHTRVVQDAECNHCLECVAHCPRPQVLSVRGLRFAMTPAVYGVSLLVGLFLFIGASKVSGHWRTRPETVRFVNASGGLDPGQIRGWMTLGDISSGYGIPVQELRRAAGLPESVPADVPLNRIATRFHLDFEPEAVREAVAALLGGSNANRAADQKAAPPPAQPARAATPAKEQPVKKNTPAPAASTAVPKRAAEAPKKDGGHEEQPVRGVMTLNEISLKTGVPASCILERIGVDAGLVNPRVPVRQWLHEAGRTMQDVRDAVEACRSPRR